MHFSTKYDYCQRKYVKETKDFFKRVNDSQFSKKKKPQKTLAAHFNDSIKSILNNERT
jgi:hypothetical protein